MTTVIHGWVMTSVEWNRRSSQGRLFFFLALGWLGDLPEAPSPGHDRHRNDREPADDNERRDGADRDSGLLLQRIIAHRMALAGDRFDSRIPPIAAAAHGERFVVI